MKKNFFAAALILISLFCSFGKENRPPVFDNSEQFEKYYEYYKDAWNGGEGDNLIELFNSWIVYDAALEAAANQTDGRGYSNLGFQAIKNEFIKNLCDERESNFFKIENSIYGIQIEFNELLEAVQKDDRFLVSKNFARYIYMRSEIIRNSGKTYAVLLVFLSAAIAIIIAFIIFYQKIYLRAQESETTLEITMNAQEAERNRLSQELHDSVAQEMRYVSMLADEIPQDSPQKKIADEIKERQKKCIEDIRAICYNLSPIDIERKNLGGALEFLCESFMKTSGISTKLTIADGVDFTVLSKEQMHNIFRIVQELLSNIQKHSAANEITVFARNATERDGNREGVCFFISDDGDGVFKQDKDEAHFGLRSINARLKTLGATIEYKGIENQGTDVKIYIPLMGGGTRR